MRFVDILKCLYRYPLLSFAVIWIEIVVVRGSNMLAMR